MESGSDKMSTGKSWSQSFFFFLSAVPSEVNKKANSYVSALGFTNTL